MVSLLGLPNLFLGFLMLKVLPAMAAVLLDAQPVGIVFLVFHRRVVASFAGATCHRDDHSVVLLSHGRKSPLLGQLRAAFSPHGQCACAPAVAALSLLWGLLWKARFPI